MLTASGQYKLRFFGTIGDTTVNETFTSGDTTYGSVESSKEFQFPVVLAEVRELEAGTKGARSAAVQAQNTAATAGNTAAAARVFGIAGVVLGAIGAVAGLGALMSARRRS